MLLQVSNQFRHTYRYRRKLSNFGLNFEKGKWRLKTNDPILINNVWKFCRRKRLHFECIEDRYVRSTDYRKMFIENYVAKKGKYFRCAYCGKRLTLASLTVDHIIPIDRAQHNRSYRILMRIVGLENINDLKNLTPACERCNKRKGRNLKGFFFNGFTGRTYRGVVVRRVTKFIFALALICSLIFLAFLLYFSFKNQKNL